MRLGSNLNNNMRCADRVGCKFRPSVRWPDVAAPKPSSTTSFAASASKRVLKVEGAFESHNR